MGTENDRLARFSEVIKQINNHVSKDEVSVAMLSEYGKGLEVEFLPTGILSLDRILGGGFARGRISEIFGEESSSKTTVALSLVANTQRNGGNVLYVDVEQALDPEWAKKLSIDSERLAFAQPSTAEEALDLVFNVAKSNLADLIVVDSVASMVTEREMDGDVGDQHIGLVARLMSQELKKLNSVLKGSKTAILFINQVREKINTGFTGGFGPQNTTPGGKALKFYASQRVEAKGLQTTKRGDSAIGKHFRYTTRKNKVHPPFKVAEAFLNFETGFSPLEDLAEYGADYGVITRNTSKTWVETQTGIVLTKTGRPGCIEFLQSNPDVYERMLNRLQEAVSNNFTPSPEEDSED